MKPNTDYNDIFNSGGMSFDAPPASLYLEHVDPILTLEQERDKLLNTLQADKEVFIGWLTTVNIKHVSTLKMETLELLVSCWLASKQCRKTSNISLKDMFKPTYKIKYNAI